MAVRERSGARGFQSILCAVDFGPPSIAALQTAINLALAGGGRVTALCVEDPLLGQGAAAVGYDVSLLRKSTLAQLRRLMRRAAGAAGLPDEQWAVATVLGQPPAAIVSVAKKRDADLIVMGTHGRSGAAKLFFGSVAEGVLRRTPVPVLVVPRGRPRRPGPARIPRRVIGAIELGAGDRRDAQRMARVAAQFGAALTLAHVVPSTPGPSWLTARLDQHEHTRLEAAQTRLAAIAAPLESGSRVALGRPNEGIVAAALDTKADLIVLALRAGHGLFAPRRGSITYQVLSGSPIPVLALPPAGGR